MKELLREQEKIKDTKDINEALAWLEKYHNLDDNTKFKNPIFCCNGIEFTYFDDADRQDGKFQIVNGSNGLEVGFDELVKMGLNNFIKEQGFSSSDEVYQTDINYDFELIYRDDVIGDFIKLCEK